MKPRVKSIELINWRQIYDKWIRGDNIDRETKIKYYELKEKEINEHHLYVVFNLMFCMDQEMRK